MSAVEAQLDLFSPLNQWMQEAETEKDRSWRQKIAVRFARWNAEHPEVYEAIVELARKAKRAGAEQYGMRALFEIARWHLRIEKGRTEDYALNNNYTAPMARLVMSREPDLRGFFETRERRDL